MHSVIFLSERFHRTDCTVPRPIVHKYKFKLHILFMKKCLLLYSLSIKQRHTFLLIITWHYNTQNSGICLQQSLPPIPN